jgi:hypothetical protein
MRLGWLSHLIAWEVQWRPCVKLLGLDNHWAVSARDFSVSMPTFDARENGLIQPEASQSCLSCSCAISMGWAQRGRGIGFPSGPGGASACARISGEWSQPLADFFVAFQS